MENKENGIDLISNCIRLFANQEQIQACKENLQDHGLDFIRLAQIFALAGSEARLKILYLLEQEKELCPCDLSDILQMTIPAVSQHLAGQLSSGLYADDLSDAMLDLQHLGFRIDFLA